MVKRNGIYINNVGSGGWRWTLRFHVGLHHLDAWKPCFCAGSLTWLEKLGASNQKGTSLIHINSEFQWDTGGKAQFQNREDGSPCWPSSQAQHPNPGEVVEGFGCATFRVPFFGGGTSEPPPPPFWAQTWTLSRILVERCKRKDPMKVSFWDLRWKVASTSPKFKKFKDIDDIVDAFSDCTAIFTKSCNSALNFSRPWKSERSKMLRTSLFGNIAALPWQMRCKFWLKATMSKDGTSKNASKSSKISHLNQVRNSHFLVRVLRVLRVWWCPHFEFHVHQSENIVHWIDFETVHVKVPLSCDFDLNPPCVHS